MEQGFCNRRNINGGLWPGRPDWKTPARYSLAKPTKAGEFRRHRRCLTNSQFVRALDPLRNTLELHPSPTEIAIHELPQSDSLRSVRSIVSNCHTVHLQIGHVRGLGSHLAPGRHKIFFEQICGQCGRNKRSAVLNKITAPSDEPKMI